MDHGSKRLNTQAIVLIGFLAVQYVLGMTANLFVPFPEGVQGSQLWQFAWTQLPVATHIIIGTLLPIGAIVFVIRSIRSKDRTWIMFSSVGLAAMIVAAGSGVLFMETQNDLYSYSMSLAFLVVLGAYAWGLFASRKAVPLQSI